MFGFQFFEGFLLGLGLLAALGPKDTFVIKNSLQGKNALTLVAICSLSDVLLISLGVLGLGAVIASRPWLMTTAMVLSILYLLYFAVQALRSAVRGGAPSIDLDGTGTQPSHRASVIRSALFHSLLTPYAWLDTVLVIGAISSTKLGWAKVDFSAGAASASLLWFVFLTLGSYFASPLFRHRRAWQILDFLVAMSMLLLVLNLLGDYPWTQ